MKLKNHPSLQGRRIVMVVLCCLLFNPGLEVHGAGRIGVANDDWTLSNVGFQQAPDAARFASNVAAWFSGGRPGRFLAYSDHFGLTGSSLSNAMAGAGHTWIVNASSPFDLPTLQGYDGVFVGMTTPVDTSVLVAYVSGGGHVYLAAACSADDPARLNPFLEPFGLHLDEVSTSSGNMPIDSTHPLFAGVDELYQQGGFSIVDLTPSDTRSQVLVSSGGQGLYAVWDSGTNQTCGNVAIDLYAGISVEGTIGSPYRIEYVSNLEDTNWATLTNLVLARSPYLIFDPDSPRWASRFYRVQCAPANGLVALGDALFDSSSDRFPTNSYRPLPVGFHNYCGYGSLAAYTLGETVSYGESVAGVATAKVHFASTLPGSQEEVYWYARDVHGDMRYLRSMVAGVVTWEASATGTPPLALPAAPSLYQCWPGLLGAERSVRDLNASAQGFSALLKVRALADDDAIGYNFYQLAVGRVVIQTSKDPAPGGSGWVRRASCD